MICDKCGKSNINSLSECFYCGAKMPPLSSNGGFADILSFNGSSPSAEHKETVKKDDTKSEGISELEMQKLFKKTDSIIKSTHKNTLFGLIAIGLSLLILISSIIIGIVTISSVKGYKEETMTQITETKKELESYKAQIDSVLEAINKDSKEESQNNTAVDDNEEKVPDNSQNETDEDKATPKNNAPHSSDVKTEDNKTN